MTTSNTVVINPPSGGNQVTIVAGITTDPVFNTVTASAFQGASGVNDVVHGCDGSEGGSIHINGYDGNWNSNNEICYRVGIPGSIDLRGGYNGSDNASDGGSIIMVGADTGSGAYNAGSINTSGASGGAGGSINTSGGNNDGGSINTSDGGGSINTSGGAGGPGGSINLSASTTGFIQFPDGNGGFNTLSSDGVSLFWNGLLIVTS